jgi:pimeloyl-ACP methyl ester carboxylesterase
LWPDYGPLVDGQGPRATTFDADLGAAELAGDRLPEVPTVVIARTPGRWRSPRADATVDQSWQDNQADLARRCQASLLIATDSGHDIPAEAPDLVAFGIDEVVRAVRTGTARVLFDPAAAHIAGATLAPTPA